MATSGVDSFYEFLDEQLDTIGSFKAEPRFDAEADCLVYYWRDQPSYGKRVNALLTVYLSVEHSEPVGCKIKGMRRIMRQLDSLDHWGCKWFDDKLKLGMIVDLVLVAPPEGPEMESWSLDEKFRGLEFDRGLVTA